MENTRYFYYKSSKRLGYDGSVNWPSGSVDFWKSIYQSLRQRQKLTKLERGEILTDSLKKQELKERREQKLKEIKARLIEEQKLKERKNKLIFNKVLQDYMDYLKKSKELNKAIVKKNTLLKLNLTPDTLPDDDQDILKLIADNRLTGKIRISYIVNNILIQSITYDLPNIPTNLTTKQYRAILFKWWKKNYNPYDWRVSSAEFVFDQYKDFKNYPKQSIVITKQLNISPKKIAQAYAEGETNCVLKHIYDWAKIKVNSANSNSAKKKYNSIINKIIKLEKKYQHGIPEEDLQYVANYLNVDIEIKDIFTSKILIKSKKKRLKVFKYVNTRLNHVDRLTQAWFKHGLLQSTKPIYETQTNLNKLAKEFDEKNIFYAYKKYNDNITYIQTLNESYQVQPNETIQEFNKTLKFTSLNYNDKTEHVTTFIKTGMHISGSIDLVPTEHLIGTQTEEIDQIKSYAQFKNCSFYQGFPTISEFLHCPPLTQKQIPAFLKSHTGIIRVKIDTSTLPIHLSKLNCYPEEITLTSPEILFLHSNNVKLELLYGAWGKSFDFEFTKKMLTEEIPLKNNKKISCYSKWSGSCGIFKTHSDLFIKTKDKEFVQHIKHSYPDINVEQDPLDKATFIINFKQKKEYVSHRMHILAFIAAYSRIQVIQQMQQIPIKNIVRVVGDGIYVKDTKDIKLNPTFRFKTKKFPKNKTCECFFYQKPYYLIHKLRPYYNTKNRIYQDMIPVFHQYVHHDGAGGTGKSRDALYKDTQHTKYIDQEITIMKYPEMSIVDTLANIDNIKPEPVKVITKIPKTTIGGIIDPMYIGISWKLVRDKVKEFGCRGTVLAKLLNGPPMNVTNFVMDESSMYTDYIVNKVQNKNPNAKIHFLGDVDINGTVYQLPPIKGVTADYSKMFHITHTKNFRVKDDNLLTALNKLRSHIKDRTTPDIFDLGFNTILRSEVEPLYTPEDYILCATKSKNKKGNGDYVYQWTNLLDKTKPKKWLITKNSKEYSNGDTLIQPNKPSNSELRHAFTVHQVQGITTKTKLFLDTRNLFDFRMAYTALSRAQYMSQIYLIM